MPNIYVASTPRQPDFQRLERVIKRQGNPDRLPFYELVSDREDDVLEYLEMNISASGKSCFDYSMKRHIKYMYELGYDYINIGRNWDFPKMEAPVANKRSYVTSKVQVISSIEHFENYTWPDIDSLDFSRFEKVKEIIPEGMKVIALCSGILENVMLLLGHEGIAYLLYDEPELVKKHLNLWLHA